MKLLPTLKVYLILFFFVILGYVFMMFPELYLPPPNEGNEEMSGYIFQLSVLVLVIIANVVTAYAFKLKSELADFWSLKKIHYFPMGVLVGIFVMALPLSIGLLTGKATWSDLKFDYEVPGLKPLSIIFLFIITLWEELWFRGIFLNYAKRYLSTLQISLFMGLLFMVSYSLYSRGDLLMVSPNFLLLGMLFILLYFYYKTNWITYGIMVGINMAAANSPFESDWLIGKFGILSAIGWGIVLFWIIKKYSKTIAKNPNTVSGA
jgi:membrane protease YdiL (CAAX protease family)